MLVLALGGTAPGVLRKAPSGPSSPVNAMPSSAADRLEPAAAFPAIRKAGTVNICVVTYREQAPARFQASCQGPALSAFLTETTRRRANAQKS